MKIVICGSMSFSKEMIKIKEKLEQQGHQVTLPRHTDEFAKYDLKETPSESVEKKINHDLIRNYFEQIKHSQAVLIVNMDKRNIKNYIGGNSFLEAGFAHVLNKKLYFVNNIPDMIYSDELRALQPIILNGDLSKIE